MRISIITPVLNGQPFIRQTVESVLGQQGDFTLEYIVRDGGSTDGTLAILKEYRARLTLVSERDGSPQAAINAGMAQAGGEILAWLNADDVYEPGALQQVADAMRRRPDRQWCYGRCRIMDADGREIRRPITWYKNLLGWDYSRHLLLCENYISQPAAFWRRELWQRVGGLSPAYKAAFDYDLWLRMAACSRAVPLRRCLARFRRHPGSISENRFELQFAEELAIAAASGNAVHRALHRFNCWKILFVYRLLAGRTKR